MRLFALAALLVALGGAQEAQAAVPTPQQSLAGAYHYWDPDAACNGSTPERSVQIVFDPTLRKRGYDGLAIGITILDSGEWLLISCTIAVMPGLPTPEECRTIYHEVGHLGMHRHEEGGIMTSPVTDEPFYQCDPTTRESVIGDIRDVFLPKSYTWAVHCTPSLRRCRATAPGAKARRYEVSADATEIYDLS